MELKDMDKDYYRSKKALDKSGKIMTTLEALKKEVKTLTRKIEDLQIQIIRSKEDGDKGTEKTAQENLKKTKTALEDKKNQLKKLEEIVKQNQSTIDEKMSELSQDPALRAHLNEVIGKKFSRKLSKLSKEKEEKSKENEILIKIQEEAKRNPNAMHSLVEIKKHSEIIAKAQAIINDPSKTPAEKAQAKTDLTTAQASLESARSTLARLFKGTVSREVIDQISSFEDLERNIKSNNKQIKGIDKQIANYSTALNNIGYEFPSNDISDSSSSTNRTSSVNTNSSRVEHSTENLPAEQPKWYQFVKRFKNWIARKNAPTRPEAIVTSTPTSQEDKKKFKDSMKYEVVRDYEEKLATDLLRQAKAQNKSSVDKDRDD